MTVAVHATIIRASAERLFRVYEDPHNITAVTGVPVRVLRVELPVRTGSLQSFAIGPPWLRMHWEAAIAQYTPPLLLVDVQKRGPFQRFRHAHCVVPLGEDRSAAIDVVDYEWRSGRVGKIVELVFIQPLIALLLRDRHRRLARLLRQTAPSRARSGEARCHPEEVAP